MSTQDIKSMILNSGIKGPMADAWKKAATTNK